MNFGGSYFLLLCILIGAAYSQDCTQNSAYFFNENNRIDIEPSTDFDLSDFTIEFWTTRSTLWDSGDEIVLMSLPANLTGWTDPYAQISISKQPTSNSLQLRTSWASGTGQLLLVAPTQLGAITTHVSFVHDLTGNSACAYINGVQSACTPVTNAPEYLGSPLILGSGIPADSSTSYNGLMDNFRIWSRALNATERDYYRLNDVSGPEPDLVLAYNFDEEREPPSTTLTDISGNDHTGNVTINSRLGFQDPRYLDSQAQVTNRPIICSGEGNCVSGLCICNPGFGGAICDTPEDIPEDVTGATNEFEISLSPEDIINLSLIALGIVFIAAGLYLVTQGVKLTNAKQPKRKAPKPSMMLAGSKNPAEADAEADETAGQSEEEGTALAPLSAE